ncbi:MAG: glycosyltransferase family 4 protein [Clostridia bacterium]|nr:glycosyltransferase family 4 protein [Clostridia bacterium]
MKKVLFTATVDSHIKHFHLPYLQWFHSQGYEVHVATNGKEEIPYVDVKHQISFERNPIKINNIKAIKNLKQLINREKFDLIHCHTPMGGVVTRLASMEAREKYHVKVIYTAHGFHFFKGASLINWILYYPIEKILSKVTDCLITINEEDYQLAKKRLKAKQTKLVPGVGVDQKKFDFEMIEKEKRELREEFGISEKDFVIIYPAELSKRKNQGMLLKVIETLKKQGYQNIKVLLPGLDSMNQIYQKQAKELKIEEEVKFLGYRTDIHKLMKISNLAVSTAKQEGLPVNLIEAIFSGLPIVATNCRGNRDVIRNQPNSFLVEIGDVLNMAEKIKQVIKNQDILKSNINNAYELKQVQKEMEKIYLGM